MLLCTLFFKGNYPNQLFNRKPSYRRRRRRRKRLRLGSSTRRNCSSSRLKTISRWTLHTQFQVRKCKILADLECTIYIFLCINLDIYCKKAIFLGTKKVGKIKKKKSVGPVVTLKCDFDQCEYICSRSDKLRFHKRIVHEGLRYKCDICDYSGTRPDKLKMHKKRKHENPQPRKVRTVKYVNGQKKNCDKCDYTADKARNLRAHMIRNHSDSVFHCDQCDYVATFQYNLKNHHDRMHSGKVLQCEKCSYSTRDANRYSILIPLKALYTYFKVTLNQKNL